MLSKRHVSQIKEPAHANIVGAEAKVFGEIANRLLGAFRFLMTGPGENGKNATGLAAAFHTVFCLSETQGRDALQKEQSGQLVEQALGVGIDQGVSLF